MPVKPVLSNGAHWQTLQWASEDQGHPAVQVRDLWALASSTGRPQGSPPSPLHSTVQQLRHRVQPAAALDSG